MAGSRSVTLDLPAEAAFARADLYFHGVDHSWSSFEARVFLDNPGADAGTSLEAGSGYAGSFHVFGHGGCFGDEGHCDVPAGPVSDFDRRRPHQLTPTSKLVVVTEPLQGLMRSHPGAASVQVTVVPVVRDSALAAADHATDVLSIASVSLLTYA